MVDSRRVDPNSKVSLSPTADSFGTASRRPTPIADVVRQLPNIQGHFAGIPTYCGVIYGRVGLRSGR